MYTIKINRAEYEAYLYSILKEFYPEKEWKLITDQTNIQRIGNQGEEGYLFFTDHSVEVKLFGIHTKIEGSFDKVSHRKALYDILSKENNRVLPWGNLTGVRPTKFAMSLCNQGKSEEAILDIYQDKHGVALEKARLSLEIAKKEANLVQSIDREEGYSLYIGIPFCPSTCIYCSFTSYSIHSFAHRVDDYLDSLLLEMDAVAHQYKERKLETIYIGGGTPTSLSAEQLERLLEAIEEKFEVSKLKEFTVEAGRADSITEEKLKIMKAKQVTRISINPQTMNDKTLEMIGRKHSVDQVRQVFLLARDLGFDNINMDVILGLPGEGIKEVEHTMNEILMLKPDSLTVHSLAIKRASALAKLIEEKRQALPAMAQSMEKVMQCASETAKNMGLEPYYLYRQKNISGNLENIGFAKPGKECIYNMVIMEEIQTIVAIGAGSSSKYVLANGKIKRSENLKNVDLYIEKINEMIERKKEEHGS